MYVSVSCSPRYALSLFVMLICFSQYEITYSSVVKHLNLLDYEYYFKITDNIEINDLSSNLLILNEILENGFDVKRMKNKKPIIIIC